MFYIMTDMLRLHPSNLIIASYPESTGETESEPQEAESPEAVDVKFKLVPQVQSNVPKETAKSPEPSPPKEIETNQNSEAGAYVEDSVDKQTGKWASLFKPQPSATTSTPAAAAPKAAPSTTTPTTKAPSTAPQGNQPRQAKTQEKPNAPVASSMSNSSLSHHSRFVTICRRFFATTILPSS